MKTLAKVFPWPQNGQMLDVNDTKSRENEINIFENEFL